MHLAAEIATQRDADQIHEVNVEGTRRLLEAAEAAGVKRFVFVSTVVTGEADGRILREDEPLPVQTAYGRSKQEGERLVRESELARRGRAARATCTGPAAGSRRSSCIASSSRGGSP